MKVIGKYLVVVFAISLIAIAFGMFIYSVDFITTAPSVRRQIASCQAQQGEYAELNDGSILCWKRSKAELFDAGQ